MPKKLSFVAALLLALCCRVVALALTPQTPAPQRAVQTQQDFVHYMELHIVRVALIAEILRDSYPNEYGDIDAGVLRRYVLETHDRNKIDDPDIQRRLFELYNVPMNTDEALAARKAVVTRLNEADQRLERRFLMARQLYGTPVGEKMQRLVTLADAIDRYNNRHSPEEFARPMLPPELLLEMNQREREMVRWANYVYEAIVVGYNYEPPCERRLKRRPA